MNVRENNEVIDAYVTIELVLGELLYAVMICPICDFIGQERHFPKVVCRRNQEKVPCWYFPHVWEHSRDVILEMARERLGITR